MSDYTSSSGYSSSDYSWSTDRPAWTWTDYGQSRRIQDLRDEVSTMNASLAEARSSARRLQSELSKVTGSLEQRLNRLTAAFDAFVEISDLRMTLGLFDEHARVRHRARQMFGEHPLPGELSDVDGYWLAPALAGLRATVDGRPAGDALALARSRDPRRAALFHVLATVLLGQAEPEMIAEALPELDPSPALYQRAVWLLAADGQLGADARDLVLRRGNDCLARLSEADREAAVKAWAKAVKPERDAAAELAAQLRPAADLITALDACERLTVLRHWVAAGLEWDGKPADEVDPMVKYTVQSLVDEGSPLELPLLMRERELRKVIESDRAAAAEPDGWESPVGSLVELLRRDVEGDDRQGRRALAIRICAPHILAAADRLAERARTPLPDEVTARLVSGTVTITQAGPVRESIDKAVARRVAASHPEHRPRRGIAYTAAIAGLGLIVLAVVSGWGWLVFAAVAAAVAGWQLWKDTKEKEQARADEQRSREMLGAEAEEAVARYVEACADLTMRRARIDEDLAALRASLAG